VVLEFHMLQDGRVTNVRVAENTVGDLFALVCQRAVLDPVPYAPWPEEMKRLIGNTYRWVRFTFYYN
jgi:predicted RNA-binding protein associated with RNAse of E/G family